MPSQRYILIIEFLALILVLQFLNIAYTTSNATEIKDVENAYNLIVCPDPRRLVSNVLATSADGRVLVFREGSDPLRDCASKVISLIEALPRPLELNKSVEMNMEYYTRLVELTINRLVAMRQVSISLKEFIREHGFQILVTRLYGDKLALVIVATSRPGGLGEEFAHIVAEAVTRVFNIYFKSVVVIYTDPNPSKTMSLLVKRIRWLLDSFAEKGITIALGYDIGIPVINVQKEAVSHVGSVQRFADIIAENLLEDSWVIVVLLDEPIRAYEQLGTHTASDSASRDVAASPTALPATSDYRREAIQDTTKTMEPSRTKTTVASTSRTNVEARTELVHTSTALTTSAVIVSVGEAVESVNMVESSTSSVSGYNPYVVVGVVVVVVLAIIAAILLFLHRR